MSCRPVLLWDEVVNWRGGSEAVVVLGFRNLSQKRANGLNRWRVRAALRSIDPDATSSRVVFCGGASDRVAPSEAALMARYAVEERDFTGEVSLEERSRTAWENVHCAIPLIEHAHRIKIVSEPLHALKARLYLKHQRPDLARRLVRGEDYRPGEWSILKPLLAGYGLFDLSRARKNLAGPEPAP